jgi:hypothetical protein
MLNFTIVQNIFLIPLFHVILKIGIWFKVIKQTIPFCEASQKPRNPKSGFNRVGKFKNKKL